jgi:hypothetical protein
MTSELTEKGFHILPTDPSLVMLNEFRKKPNLPTPIRADGMALPFAANVAEGAFSLRVIWHLPTIRQLEQMIGEMARISMGKVVLDISNERRWRNPLLRPLIAIYFRFKPSERRKHETSILLTLERFTGLAERLGLQVNQVLALDVLSPIWLKPLPLGIAKLFYPIIFRLENASSVIIPPGRLLISLTRNPLSDRTIPD